MEKDGEKIAKGFKKEQSEDGKSQEYVTSAVEVNGWGGGWGHPCQ